MKNRLRVIWILLQGAFLPLVYFAGKFDNTPAGIILLLFYVVLVYCDAVLTCKIFEPKDKA
jgi:uncharacterized integral membrane protein